MSTEIYTGFLIETDSWPKAIRAKKGSKNEKL